MKKVPSPQSEIQTETHTEIQTNTKPNFISDSLRILIASDHAGFPLKEIVITELVKLGFKIVDLGCNSATESVDYPDYAKKLCHELNTNANDVGILICGSGVGISITANRYKNIRAALCHNVEIAKLSRMHNDANVICCGARMITPEIALETIHAFLVTDFEGGRHSRRVDKISS